MVVKLRLRMGLAIWTLLAVATVGAVGIVGIVLLVCGHCEFVWALWVCGCWKMAVMIDIIDDMMRS